MDKEIKCVDCSGIFIFSAGEQDFYREKQLQDPKRCGDCRKIKARANNNKKWKGKQ